MVAVGPHGSGKSYWVKAHVRKSRKRVLIFDAQGEYRSHGKESIKGIRSHPSLGAFFQTARMGGKLGKESIVGSRRTFAAFCQFAYTLGNCMVVIEELSRWSRQVKTSEAFLDLCDRSRHAGIELVGISSRPAALPTELREQVNEYVAFRATEPTTLRFWKEARGQAAAKAIANLPLHKHLLL